MLCNGKSRTKVEHYFGSFRLWETGFCLGVRGTEAGEDMGLRRAETEEILELQESHHMKRFAFVQLHTLSDKLLAIKHWNDQPWHITSITLWKSTLKLPRKHPLGTGCILGKRAASKQPAQYDDRHCLWFCARPCFPARRSELSENRALSHTNRSVRSCSLFSWQSRGAAGLQHLPLSLHWTPSHDAQRNHHCWSRGLAHTSSTSWSLLHLFSKGLESHSYFPFVPYKVSIQKTYYWSIVMETAKAKTSLEKQSRRVLGSFSSSHSYMFSAEP